MRGSLIVVGSGISSPAHVTTEAISHIENAERVFSIVADQLTEYWLRSINPRTESFASLYAIGKPRLKTYAEMVERVVGAVKDGFRVCAVAYGHPGVAAYPLHAAIRELRESGYAATMLPGISAEDCLFADLGIAPVTFGCQSFEATDFLMRQRPLDISVAFILWQIGVIGEASIQESRDAWNLRGIEALRDKLRAAFPADHRVTVYEAARYAASGAVIHHVALEDLAQAPVAAVATLYVPPAATAGIDYAMAERLGLDVDAFARRSQERFLQTREPLAVDRERPAHQSPSLDCSAK